MLHASKMVELMEKKVDHAEAFESSYKYATDNINGFVNSLINSGWNVDHLFLEEVNFRYKLLS